MQTNKEYKFDDTKYLAEGKLAYNFCPGPCTLPRAVLDKCAADMINYKGTDQSVMELSHRGLIFNRISEGARAEVRELLSVPDNFTVLFMQGGATN